VERPCHFLKWSNGSAKYRFCLPPHLICRPLCIKLPSFHQFQEPVSKMVWKEPHPTRLPSPAEIAESRAIIQDADLKIAALTSQIESLEKLRFDLQTIRDNQASFISNFRRLPPELLQEIALYYIDEMDPYRVGVLDQVCSSLREVVLRMKWLWQTIHIVQADRNDYCPVSLLIYSGSI
jgi:hypothetical protein